MARPWLDPRIAWTAEIERGGAVVFPRRRWPMLLRLFVFTVLIISYAGSLIYAWRRDEFSGGYVTLCAIALPVFLVRNAYLVWQIITRRPILTVDAEGITLGRKHLAWSAVGKIRTTFGVVRIHPDGGKATRRIGISHENVKDVQLLTPWLRLLLDRHRSAGAASGDE
jgi:hypothetical protein